ncbi:nuclear pore complex protein Nup54 [Hyalella azteca]|uniref:Nuclear pore complex protein Nup54 n=2 Tax=Hyalella azteca TaxID=294128 RepID=A0A8B7PHH1_HYAAZ|nr:nuclear pore complex protein Nup54 [Hyalella azteca]
MAAFSFGSNTSGFGSGGGSSSMFGTGNKSFAFGSPSTTTSASAFGTNTNSNTFSGFGNISGTNTGFGNSAPATNSGFSFGSNTGALGTNSNTGTGFTFGSNKPAGGGFSFGSNTNTGLGTGTSSGFGLGTNTAFGTNTTTSSAFGTGTFGAGTNTSSGFGSGGLFGGGLKTTQPMLGFGLNSSNNNTAFKGFGTGGCLTQQPQQQQQQQQQQQGASVSLYMAVCAPAYFSDERDDVLKKWNQLQAVWGCGKGFYAPGLPPVEFTPDNEFCHFKAVGYIKMPSFSPEEGLVELVISKKESLVREQQAGLVGELCKLYGLAQETESLLLQGQLDKIAEDVAQETESLLLQGQLDKIAEDVCSVQSRLAALNDHLTECHRRQRLMAHRVLALSVTQECHRKRGVPITGAEEQLRLRLENLHAQLHAPTMYMGKLNELLSQVTAQGNNGGNKATEESSSLSPDTERDVKEFLSWQQDGITEVVAILKNDIKAFDAMIKSRTK